MMVLVTYDVKTESADGQSRLRKISKICLDFGQRVQYSVFECELQPAQWELLKARLLAIFNAEEDSLRFYYLGANWRRRIEHHGSKASVDLDHTLLI